jgi:multidrug efflux pump subunit AcrB
MINWFARNSVAANLLLVAIALAGIMALRNMPLDIYPVIDFKRVSVSVPLRGATPEDMELGIAVRIEEAVQDLEGIERIVSNSVEGSTTVSIEIDSDYDSRELLDDIKSRVDAINTFPADTERPIIRLNAWQFDVIEMVLAGPQSDKELIGFAEQVRDDILRMDGITLVDLESVRNYEIAIEASEDRLREYGLTLANLSDAIRNSSVDLSGGNVRTDGGDVLIRSKGQAYRGDEFANIVVKTNVDGSIIRLGDVANVIDGFEEGAIRTRFNGKNAVFLGVRRTGEQSAIDVARKVRNYVDERQDSLPAGMELSYWDDDSVVLADRLGILVRNALQGALLVIGLLALFLRPSVAFWVFLGIPMSFLGAFATMVVFDISLNVMSAFGFIIVLGIVVDDAIVTGENVYTHLRRGEPGLAAAINGTKEVASPVTFGVLTTVAAFLPIAFVEGMMGNMFGAIPMVVIPVLLFSLIESKFILPAHLKHIEIRKDGDSERGFVRWQQNFADGFERLILRYYQPLLQRAINYRYATLASFVGGLILMIALVTSGWTRFIFFPSIEGETATVSLQMPAGTPFKVTDEYVQQIVTAAEDLQARYADPDTGKSAILNILAVSGVSGRSTAPNAGRVQFEITTRSERSADVTMAGLVSEWRKAIGPVPGAESLTFRSGMMHIGSPIDVQLLGSSLESLQEVGDEIKTRLAAYEGVYEIEDSQSDGKEELVVELTPQGHLLGLSRSEVVKQVGSAFKGLQAQRIQRDRDDIRVLVRFSASERESLDTLGKMLITAPDGRMVPLGNVATLKPSRGPSKITRIDLHRTLNIRAEIDKQLVNATALQAQLTAELDELVAGYPSIQYTLEGESRQQRESFASLSMGLVIVLFAIYCLLALPLKSYFQPLLVMSIIPFGIIGAVIGHWIMGYGLSLMSILGLMALLGVVINDSLVLVDFVNKRHRGEGEPLYAAVSKAGVARFRPVMLTSLTTFFGLAPLLIERSQSAQFIIPMAISLAFGIIFATVITLFLVPANLMIADDVRRFFNRQARRLGEVAAS